MISEEYTKLNAERVPWYCKSVSDEGFLSKLGSTLGMWESVGYRQGEFQFPLLFVVGTPRSGTTLLAQVLSHCLNVSYIDHVAARFWLAPLTGIRLSQALFGSESRTDFCSDHASTFQLSDIHAFGYFWRHWLKIDGPLPVKKDVDWPRLQSVLYCMQQAFKSGICFKNLFSIPYMKEFVAQLPTALYVHINRDPLDTMVSILDSRRLFYGRDDRWWSIAPPEYEWLRHEPPMIQIAGQVYYLQKLLQQQTKAIGSRVVNVSLEELCENPLSVLGKVIEGCGRKMKIAKMPPESFKLRQFHNREDDKEIFRQAVQRFEEMDRGSSAD